MKLYANSDKYDPCIWPKSKTLFARIGQLSLKLDRKRTFLAGTRRGGHLESKKAADIFLYKVFGTDFNNIIFL
jgi:hypothetical protein